MADKQEKILTDRYNSLADQLKALERGDPRHIEVAARLVAAKKELEEYHAEKKT